jgi:hypothetical protein
MSIDNTHLIKPLADLIKELLNHPIGTEVLLEPGTTPLFTFKSGADWQDVAESNSSVNYADLGGCEALWQYDIRQGGYIIRARRK